MLKNTIAEMKSAGDRIRDGKLQFGQYKGMHWLIVLRADPGYLAWCLTKFDDLYFPGLELYLDATNIFFFPPDLLALNAENGSYLRMLDEGSEDI